MALEKPSFPRVSNLIAAGLRLGLGYLKANAEWSLRSAQKPKRQGFPHLRANRSGVNDSKAEAIFSRSGEPSEFGALGAAQEELDGVLISRDGEEGGRKPHAASRAAAPSLARWARRAHPGRPARLPALGLQEHSGALCALLKRARWSRLKRSRLR